jgi:hypothetical protein
MSANPRPMISVSDLVVSYGNCVAVKGISRDWVRGCHMARIRLDSAARTDSPSMSLGTGGFGTVGFPPAMASWI